MVIDMAVLLFSVDRRSAGPIVYEEVIVYLAIFLSNPRGLDAGKVIVYLEYVHILPRWTGKSQYGKKCILALVYQTFY
ncbi:MAG: hypothetical protein ABFC73_14780 [Clostridiaceae bacterium]